MQLQPCIISHVSALTSKFARYHAHNPILGCIKRERFCELHCGRSRITPKMWSASFYCRNPFRRICLAYNHHCLPLLLILLISVSVPRSFPANALENWQSRAECGLLYFIETDIHLPIISCCHWTYNIFGHC